MKRRFRYVFLGGMAVVVALVCCACSSGGASTAAYEQLVRPYRFNLVRWELEAFTGPNNPFTIYPEVDAWDTDPVLRYVQLQGEIKGYEQQMLHDATNATESLQEQRAILATLQAESASLEPTVERIIAAQVTTAFQEAGIYTPLDRYIHLNLTWPRVWFKLDKPIHLLVVSPRAKIERTYEALLTQELADNVVVNLENQIAHLDASGLVVPLGGFGASYPSFVAADENLDFILQSVCEEWLHQYLAFTPLGFRYVLHLLRIKPDHAIATMNETLAGMVSKEVAQRVMQRYYAPKRVYRSDAAAQTEEFDFNAEMRQIRIHVDDLLSLGQVAEAEAYMDERRDYLEQHGYYIRKLNQAYFAFYGTYADSPTSIDPIGDAMRSLKAQSSSLADFLNTAVTLTSQEQLFNRVESGSSEKSALK